MLIDNCRYLVLDKVSLMTSLIKMVSLPLSVLENFLLSRNFVLLVVVYKLYFQFCFALRAIVGIRRDYGQ